MQLKSSIKAKMTGNLRLQMQTVLSLYNKLKTHRILIARGDKHLTYNNMGMYYKHDF